MRKILMITFCLTLWAISPYAIAIDTAWVKYYNGPGDSTDMAEGVTTDKDGNIFVTGHCWGFGTGYDWATIKYQPNGDTCWVRNYNGTAGGDDMPSPFDCGIKISALSTDNSGNLYVTGKSNNIYTDEDYTTIKYRPNGDVAWIGTYDAAELSDVAFDLVVDSLGNVYVTGSSYSYTTYADIARRSSMNDLSSSASPVRLWVRSVLKVSSGYW